MNIASMTDGEREAYFASVRTTDKPPLFNKTDEQRLYDLAKEIYLRIPEMTVLIRNKNEHAEYMERMALESIIKAEIFIETIDNYIIKGEIQ
jgi:hypothetical protein